MIRRVMLIAMVALQATWFALLAPLHHHAMHVHAVAGDGLWSHISACMEGCHEHLEDVFQSGHPHENHNVSDDCSICHLIATTLIPADHKLDLTLLALLEIKPMEAPNAQRGVEVHLVSRGRDPPAFL